MGLAEQYGLTEKHTADFQITGNSDTIVKLILPFIQRVSFRRSINFPIIGDEFESTALVAVVRALDYLKKNRITNPEHFFRYISTAIRTNAANLIKEYKSRAKHYKIYSDLKFRETAVTYGIDLDLTGLSDSEKEIITLWAKGLTQRQIAKICGCQPPWICKSIKRILKNLGESHNAQQRIFNAGRNT